MFYFAYSGLSCVTYGTRKRVLFFAASLVQILARAGISVASGLFIPSLLSGSALGRFIGELLKLGGYNVDAGTFALIGMIGKLCTHTSVLSSSTPSSVMLSKVLLPSLEGRPV